MTAPAPHPQENMFFIKESELKEVVRCLRPYLPSTAKALEELVRSRPHTPAPQWTDEEVMKELQDAFDRGVEAAESTIDMQKHDATICTQERNATLDCEEIRNAVSIGQNLIVHLNDNDICYSQIIKSVQFMVDQLESLPTPTKEAQQR